ncbi:MAG: enoyl-CoA hydratase-related protein [Chloroflexota bacterium]
MTITVEKENAIATITLNHPPVNAITFAMLNELVTALDTLDGDDSVRVIVITGAGDQMFSAGADFQEFASDRVREFQQQGVAVFNLIERFRKPVIAAINGGAFGGGFELALACHLRFMADRAELAFTEVRLGIAPGWGGTQRLPRLIGRTRALELLLTGDRIEAQDARIFGLVNRVTTPADLMRETQAFAARLAQGAPLAMAAIMDSVVRGADMPLTDGLTLEGNYALELGETEDALIGVTSFLQRQEPKFKGR